MGFFVFFFLLLTSLEKPSSFERMPFYWSHLSLFYLLTDALLYNMHNLYTCPSWSVLTVWWYVSVCLCVCLTVIQPVHWFINVTWRVFLLYMESTTLFVVVAVVWGGGVGWVVVLLQLKSLHVKKKNVPFTIVERTNVPCATWPASASRELQFVGTSMAQ